MQHKAQICHECVNENSLGTPLTLIKRIFLTIRTINSYTTKPDSKLWSAFKKWSLEIFERWYP
ncbi:MAG: hypothetical protein DHS20C01_04850 [marine bacterium B5-7]|nr:MAG: hypothetical protein DHS20C01_04850 [marine bacterium B5-7]